MDKLIPHEEVEFAKEYIALFQSRNYEGITLPLNPVLKTDNLRSQLEQVAVLFPTDSPKNVELIGSNVFTTNDKWQANLTFQYEFPESWLVVNIILERLGDGELVVSGVNAAPIKDSLKNINRFTLEGKTVTHYVFLVLAVIILAFVLISFIVCIRTPIRKRKWLWAVFTLLGFVRFTINWTSGQISLQPIHVMLFGSSYMAASEYAPVMLSAAVPLGAIIFWIKRNALTVIKEVSDEPSSNDEYISREDKDENKESLS